MIAGTASFPALQDDCRSISQWRSQMSISKIDANSRQSLVCRQSKLKDQWRKFQDWQWLQVTNLYYRSHEAQVYDYVSCSTSSGTQLFLSIPSHRLTCIYVWESHTKSSFFENLFFDCANWVSWVLSFAVQRNSWPDQVSLRSFVPMRGSLRKHKCLPPRVIFHFRPPTFELRARHYPRCPDLSSMQVSSKDMCESWSAPRGSGSSNSKGHAAFRWLSRVQLQGCSLDSYLIGVGMADAALLLYVVPPKTHGADDRSSGEIQRSAEKAKK